LDGIYRDFACIRHALALDASLDITWGNALKTVKVLALTKYGRLGASSRLRSLQYLPWLQRADLAVTVQSLLSDADLQERYQNGGYGLGPLLSGYVARLNALWQRRQFDVLWIEKEALPWMPLLLERLLLAGVPYVLDYDDAVFHNYDKHSNSLLRYFFGQRLDGLMAQSALVIGGNGYLAQRARDAGAKWVEVLPTVIDLERYSLPPSISSMDSGRVPRIVWIGSPTTEPYLQLLCEPLRMLAKSHAFVLRVIGGGGVDLPGVQVEAVPWAEETEVASISECAVGVMPLLDSVWERGKCGYKLIQYMACGLPVVASNVGVNPEIVQQGENGYLASSPDEWVVALGALLADQVIASRMGSSGRSRVERLYCLQKTGPQLAALLRAAAGGC
jgi:glycosyltransferase involved in cell wall biosynthesis